ncbi:5-bromo-4-chloroindolyl phosphate hydrolysis family protein [Citreimonas salinaria]|uniref:5-bromo-4-chloroindolyl phosphate hydrolysis protein n=1 Tax=Citreimonas salinaria TaxID=321339 RepID=A0A1H3I0V7_9RHOB|nr:5-bromo-4-chloroindolyl phosphate hydrolysis family protein [Citreimonas salinaria]SDY21356.1 5-bromo-4-chloroindolyl phosphate hydrolysis protein [Citreimonas salinaria]
MARRYGDRHSPGAAAQAGPLGAPPRVDPVGARSNVMFLPPVVLAFTSLGAGAAGFAAGLLGAGALMLGAWLLRDGLRAEAAYAHRTIARRPALPRKLLAAVMCGIGTAIAAWTSQSALAAPLLFGASAAALHLGAFGLDPMRDKGLAGDTLQGKRVAKVVDEAEAHLTDMAAAARSTGDRDIEARVDRLAACVRDMIRRVEKDPRDLVAARRYLGVYLIGARDAARKYADLDPRTRAAGARDDFLRLLADLEASFGEKTQTLLLEDTTALEVEIGVLRDRLRREGVALDP